MEMNSNGEESESQQKERVMYQRGSEVMTKVRHQVQDPIVGRNAEYKAQDVMCSAFYMHRQTVAQVASEVRSRIESIDSLDEEQETEVLDAITELLYDIKGSIGPTDGDEI